MYCDKCGRLAHGDRPCGEIIPWRAGEVSSPAMTGPTMVVVAPPQTRLEAGGWFTRTFLTCAGVMAAIMLAIAGVLVVRVTMQLERDAATMREYDVFLADRAKLTESAIRFAKPQLAKHGIDTLSDDAFAMPYDGDVLLAGTGRAQRGGLQQFQVRFHVATFGKEQRWSLRSLIIEGKEHYSPPDSREGL